MRKAVTNLSVAAVLLSFLSPACTSSRGAQVGQPAPDFTLSDLEAADVSLSSLRGKVVALVFWASWCPHCREEIPELVKLDKETKGTGLEIMAISHKESADRLRPFAATHGITYTVLLDPTGAVFSTYGIAGVPSLVVVDREGIIRFKGAGLPEKARKIIDELVGRDSGDSHG